VLKIYLTDQAKANLGSQFALRSRRYYSHLQMADRLRQAMAIEQSTTKAALIAGPR